MEREHVVAVPGKESCIDIFDVDTGRTRIQGNTLAEVQEREPGAVVMTLAEWTEAKAKRQEAVPLVWHRTTEQRFFDMLEVLPPIEFGGGRFMVSEPVDHCARTGVARFEGYKKVGQAFFVTSRPCTRKEFRTLG